MKRVTSGSPQSAKARGRSVVDQCRKPRRGVFRKKWPMRNATFRSHNYSYTGKAAADNAAGNALEYIRPEN
jgi:hypothetical protein